MTGEYEILRNDNEKQPYLTLVLSEDEKLRRIGNQFVFKATSEEERYTQHNGELCTIKRALTPKECDILCTGLMWEAEFPNGDSIHVFDEELRLPEHTKSHKPPLAEQITNAQEKTSFDPHTPNEKSQER